MRSRSSMLGAITVIRAVRHGGRPPRLIAPPRGIADRTLTIVLMRDENGCHQAPTPSDVAGRDRPRSRSAPAASGRPGPATRGQGRRGHRRGGVLPAPVGAQRVGGNHVDVTGLTKPGAEPHDLELTPEEVAGSRPRSSSTSRASSRPSTTPSPTQVDAAARRRDRGRPHRRGDRGRARPRRRDRGASTPSTRRRPRPALLARPDAFRRGREGDRRALATVDPANAAAYRANADALVAELDALDAEFGPVSGVPHNDLVTGHVAFGYLAQRYGLDRTASPGSPPRPSPTPPRCATSPPACGARRDARSTARPSYPASPRPWPTRPAPRSPCSTPSRGSPTPRPARTTSR